MAERLPKTLYHYCSVDTFFNIIKNKSIWLSDVEKSNDTLELSYMKKEYANQARLAAFAFIAYHKKNNIPYDEQRLNVILEVLSELSDSPISKTWVFCLSEKGDLLSQWRGYADDGYGISIGFDRQHIFKIIDSFLKSRTTKLGVLWLEKINYSQEDMKKEIADLIDPLEFGQSMTVEEFQNRVMSPLAKIESISPFYKSTSFKEEKEWRLALTAILENNCEYATAHEETPIATLGQFEYWAINKNLVSHFELEFKQINKAINKIILGPKCKVSTDEMRYYLISKGLLKNINDKSIHIGNSSSSYR